MRNASIKTAHLPEVHVLVDKIKSGRSVLRVAIEYGVSEGAISRRLKEGGYKLKKYWGVERDEKRAPN